MQARTVGPVWRCAAAKVETVVNNHSAKIVGAGISDAKTLEYFARMLDRQGRRVA